jgi:hypothetical protein
MRVTASGCSSELTKGKCVELDCIYVVDFVRVDVR